MMTVAEAEAEMARRAAEKGRSASFCATSQSLSALQSAHSSTEIHMEVRSSSSQVTAFLQAQQQASSSPRSSSRFKVSHTSARRSQSCKISGSSRPPRIRRRESPRGSGSSDVALQLDEEANLFFERAAQQAELAHENAPYNPFLRKVPSCGKLVTLAPDGTGSGEEAEGSPVLRRTASARRPTRPPNAPSPNHSPTPTRVLRPSQKGRSGTTKRPAGSSNATTSGTRRGGEPGGGGGSSYLDVKPSGSSEGLTDDSYLLRNFATTNKGIINRGDSFRRRRSRSNSVQPPVDGAALLVQPPGPTLPTSLDLATPPQTPDHTATTPTPQQVATPDSAGDSEPVSNFRMCILGATGVGKTALIHQFKTSECINAYDCNPCDESEQSVSILLNNIESEVVFVNLSTPQEVTAEIARPAAPDGWMVVYSITDKASFQKAAEELNRLNSHALLRGRAVILVGNKCELVRSRAVNMDDGRDLACSYGAKFMEISVGMNHRCDELLVGVVNQLRIRYEAEKDDDGEHSKDRSWTRNRSLMRASMKAKRVINRIMGKTEAKYKNCEDFQS